MMRKVCFIFTFLITLSVSLTAQSDNDIQSVIRGIELRFAPDKRVVIFDIKSSFQNDTLILEGETSHPEAYRELVKQLPGNVRNNIRLLPDEVIGEKNRGVIYNSVAKLHAGRSFGSEIVSELLLGMPVKLLDKKGGWRRVQTPEGYIGWISEAVKPMNESELRAYNAKQKVVITTLFTSSYEKANIHSIPISDLVMGDMLELTGETNSFFHVVYPDGRKACVQKTDAKKLDNWLTNIHFTQESIIKTANQFTGIPYVWGGSSSKGLDCSGFTKLVYFLHGIILPRDASQQIFCGDPIIETDSFDSLLPGDLLFFGIKATEEKPIERVIHVGIYIGSKRFIHASDFIRIGSFDPTDELFDEYNTKRYLRTKRIIGATNTVGIQPIFDNELYQ